MGRYVHTVENISNNNFLLNINNLKQGYYYLKVTDTHNNSGVKGFVISE